MEISCVTQQKKKKKIQEALGIYSQNWKILTKLFLQVAHIRNSFQFFKGTFRMISPWYISLVYILFESSFLVDAYFS